MTSDFTTFRPIRPVILCGGSGTRLWPVSRQSYPKQFVDFDGGDSLLQSTAERFAGPQFLPPLVVTAEDFRFVVQDQLAAIGHPPERILIEPEPRNTAPAVLAAVLDALRDDPDALLLVAPSDHAIADPAAFVDAVQTGRAAAENGAILCFGIAPDRPETGFGYIELDAPPTADGGVMTPRGFVEKPGSDTAAAMLAEGRFLWNAGIFLFAARTMLDAFKAHAPDLIETVTKATDDARDDGMFRRLAPTDWTHVRSVSIDYAIMERAQNLAVIPYHGAWSDLGSWSAIWQRSGADDAGLATRGAVTQIDCTDSYLATAEDGIELVGIGLDGIVAVATGDAVLVADKTRVQDVSKAVADMKARSVPQATRSRRDHRPWGWFDVLALGERFQVKRIVVKPGAKLSLQSHVHRSEHWIVVSGTARVTVGDTVSLVSETESVHVPLGAVHRLENPGRVPMVLIEVQTGTYLGEDDIVRYDDDYRRS
ncbi:mannose-1-phosphate guanylyltransferase/mannose-6-phosphate isomerase [Anianabacter salinae]|uniref:mannose-1-phosphate guanylyltransferase/mannose-6-phosphate isomerase n=1 Tax=Anianabacter salinae TaxID=2851023 RepID=UPI00225E25D2|nr:mannose-1-phosphate guanylyltransferase/mannose-6-phosphate isomerase [Anianabacter salinae]MBV0911126.1 mannose-1-phosphate guanylyltransferase/mannose-6-phosphate isomerase [Anianabacter salinae]